MKFQLTPTSRERSQIEVEGAIQETFGKQAKHRMFHIKPDGRDPPVPSPIPTVDGGSRRMRAPKITTLLGHSHYTGKGWVDFDPTAMTDSEISGIFEKQANDKPNDHRSFMTYYGGEHADRKDMKARENCKLCPWHTEISYPTSMQHSQKTVLFKRFAHDC